MRLPNLEASGVTRPLGGLGPGAICPPLGGPVKITKCGQDHCKIVPEQGRAEGVQNVLRNLIFNFDFDFACPLFWEI